MTKSELIEKLINKYPKLPVKTVEQAVREILALMVDTLATGDCKNRIEVRGFGSFSLHYRDARVGRNPKTGEKVQLEGKHSPHFKPGKALKERVNLK